MHPDLLPHVTPIVLTALTSPEIALYATMALKDMSRDCAEGMKPYSEVRKTTCILIIQVLPIDAQSSAVVKYKICSEE